MTPLLSRIYTAWIEWDPLFAFLSSSFVCVSRRITSTEATGTLTAGLPVALELVVADAAAPTAVGAVTAAAAAAAAPAARTAPAAAPAAATDLAEPAAVFAGRRAVRAAAPVGPAVRFGLVALSGPARTATPHEAVRSKQQHTQQKRQQAKEG